MQFNKKLIIKLFFSNFFIFIFLYLILEIFTGNLLFKKKLDCAYLLCNKTYNFLTPFEFYEKNEKIIYHRDEYGFRGRRKDINNIDVLAIGGSTTDERFLKLDDTWTEKLEKLFLNSGLDIDIVNAGVDGQSTIGHIWNFDNWFKKLKKFRTKYIIFYIGINERLDLITYDNYLPSNLSLLNNLKYWVKKNNGITYKLLSYIYINYFIDNTYIVSKGVSHGDRKPNYKQIELLNELSEEYVKHVNTNINKLYEL